MTGTFISLHETDEARFHSIIEGELTFDAKQIIISAPEMLKGITVAAERFAPVKDTDKKFLSRLGIKPMPQIIRQKDKAELLRNYLENRQLKSALA